VQTTHTKHLIGAYILNFALLEEVFLTLQNNCCHNSFGNNFYKSRKCWIWQEFNLSNSWGQDVTWLKF